MNKARPQLYPIVASPLGPLLLIGDGEALTGYGGGLACKAWLLAHEQGRAVPPGSGPRQLALTL